MKTILFASLILVAGVCAGAGVSTYLSKPGEVVLEENRGHKMFNQTGVSIHGALQKVSRNNELKQVFVLLVEGEGKGTVQVTVSSRPTSCGGLLDAIPPTVRTFTVAYNTSGSRRVVVCDTSLDPACELAELIVSSTSDPTNSVTVWSNDGTPQ